MRLRLTPMVVVALLAGAPAAHAETELAAGPDVAFGGVRAAGAETVYGDGDFGGARLYAVREGERPRLVATPTPRGAGSKWFEFDASPTHLIFTGWLEREAGEEIERARIHVGAGPLDRPKTILERCAGTDNPVRAVAASVDTVTWAGTCDNGSRIMVVDTVGARRFTVAGQPLVLRIAGRFLAYQAAETPAIVVIDQRTGEEVYRVPVTADPAYQTGSTYAFDLQDDGTIVVLDRRPVPEERLCEAGIPIRVASPAQPAGTVLPVTACEDVVSIGGGRIAFAREAAGGIEQLVTANLSGADVRTVAQMPAVRFANFDWDGNRMSWSARECPGAAIYTQAGPGGGTPADGGPAECPVRIVSRRLRVDRRGRVAVRVRCPNGCAGTLILRGAGSKRRSAELAVARGATKTIRVRLTRRARRKLRRGPRTRRVGVAVFSGNAQGSLRTRAQRKLPLRTR